MNFDQWWDTLTIKEQTVIGKNNARFVFESGVAAERERLQAFMRQMFDAYTLSSVPGGLRNKGESK